MFKKHALPAAVAIIALLISFALESWAKNITNSGLLWGIVRDFLPHISHLFYAGAYVAVGYIGVKELLENVVFPATEEGVKGMIFPEIKERWDDFSKLMYDAIAKKEITFGEVHYGTVSERRIDSALLQNIAHEAETDNDIKKIYELIKKENFRLAVSSLKELIKHKPKSNNYSRHLVTTLIISPNKQNWEEAKRLLLSGAGTAQQFHRLALAYWQNGTCDGAKELAEEGYKRIVNSNEVDEDIIGALRNSLAYYNAELNTNLDQALQLAREEVKRRENKDSNSLEYWDAIDTLGYVEIVSAKTVEELTTGLEHCLHAFDNGVKDLYSKHKTRFEQRLNELNIGQ